MFNRSDLNVFKKWILDLDKTTFFTVSIIVIFGVLIMLSVSPAITDRIGSAQKLIFFQKQLSFVLLGFIIIFTISILTKEQICKISIIAFVICMVLLGITAFFGIENKGARRWLNIMGFSLQISEILRPFFVVVNSYILVKFSSKNNYNPNLKFILSAILLSIVAIFLILQPDIGMFTIYMITWLGQMFIANLSMILFLLLISGTLILAVILYAIFPHVRFRINSFISSGHSPTYQVKKSLQSISNGGFFGKGPGEGEVKYQLPDSHTDFIFSVIAEEFGYIMCFVLLSLYCLIIFRILNAIRKEYDKFSIYVLSGIVFMFSFQVFVNIGVSLNMLPTKGTTLPFISYGGSALFGEAIMIGVLLIFTRKQYSIDLPYDIKKV